MRSVIVLLFLVANTQGQQNFATIEVPPGQEYGVQAMPRGQFDNKHGRCCCFCDAQPCNYGYRCYPPDFGHVDKPQEKTGWQYVCIEEPRQEKEYDSKGNPTGKMIVSTPLQEVRKYSMAYFRDVNDYVWIHRHKYKDKFFTNFYGIRDLSSGRLTEVEIMLGNGVTRKEQQQIHTHECSGLFHEDGTCDVKHTCKQGRPTDCDAQNGVVHNCLCVELCTPPAAPPLPPFAPYPPGLPPFIPPIAEDSPAAAVTSSIVQPLLALLSTAAVAVFYARA